MVSHASRLVASLVCQTRQLKEELARAKAMNANMAGQLSRAEFQLRMLEEQLRDLRREHEGGNGCSTPCG